MHCYVSYQQNNWSSLLPFAEIAYNNAVHSSTGYIPFQVATGQDFPAIPELDVSSDNNQTPNEWATRIRDLWPQIRKALGEATEEYKKQADKKRAPLKPLAVGDLMYLSTKYIKLQVPSHKLGPKYIGPFPVAQVINPVTVRLILPPILGKIHPMFHSRLLKPVTTMRDTPK